MERTLIENNTNIENTNNKNTKIKKTKLDIISGFLGAGKTTFIMKLIDQLYQDENIVILENEFGRINIDQETLGRVGLTVKPIQASCICCSGSGDLYTGIYEIINQYNPERIIVEPTGIAKLSEIKKIILESDLVDLCEIDHIVTIVDAKNYQTRTMISKEFFEDQIRASEVIFLSKMDQIDHDKVEQVKEAINRINRNCLVITEPWEEFEPDQLRQWISHKQESFTKQPMYLQKKHKNDYENYLIESAKGITVDWVKQFTKDADQGAYGEIQRVKGICKDPKEGWYSVEAVPGETKIVLLSQENTNVKQSQISIIGRNLEIEKLDKLEL